jgi:hypothetical protein
VSNAGNLRLVPSAAPAKRRSELSHFEKLARLAFIAGMRANGWTVVRAAHECDCSTDSIERYVSGRRAVPGSVLVAVGAVSLPVAATRRAA